MFLLVQGMNTFPKYYLKCVEAYCLVTIRNMMQFEYFWLVFGVNYFDPNFSEESYFLPFIFSSIDLFVNCFCIGFPIYLATVKILPIFKVKNQTLK